MDEIIGRKGEQGIFQKILDRKEASLIAVYGRRRIGKTYLVKNFFRNKGLFFHLTGIQDAPVDVQLQNFSVEFTDRFLKGKEMDRPKSWFAAFQLLRKEIEKVPKHSKVILFFDEVPWMATPRSRFLQALEHLWNRYLSDLPNVILIICGSAASWMIEHVLANKGGLHGRVTHEMRLLPFTLKETEDFLQKKQIHLDRKQILELYMCLGGVAKYLSYLERGKSVGQLIGDLCFSYNAPLISEFHKLYRSLFHRYEEHVLIVKALGAHRSGLSYQELVKKTGLSTGGSFSKRLEELKQSGFITEISTYGEPDTRSKYLLIDEYSLFYLAWNAGVSSLELQSRTPDYWLRQRNSPSWKSWTGHAFEACCLKHIEGIKMELGVGAVQTKASKWRFVPKRGSGEVGAEVDLVLDRADQCLNLCEMKFYEEEFVIDREYRDKLRKKKECFERFTQTKKPVFMTLITTQGTKRNDHYFSVVDQELTMSALFAK